MQTNEWARFETMRMRSKRTLQTLVLFDFRCRELRLFERCEILNISEINVDKINLIHAPEHYANLKRISSLDVTEQEKEASQYDSVYFNKVCIHSCLRKQVVQMKLGNLQKCFEIMRDPQ